jgi:hypothetical protein
MENLPDKHQPTALQKLSQNAITEFKKRVKSAIKIDHGINGITLIRFKKDVGDDNALFLLSTLIKRQSEFFNLVDNITDKQSVDIATLMMEEFPFISVEDLVVCFRFAKTGKELYEKPMSRLDGRIIFNWLNQYIEEKYDRIELLEKQKNEDFKNEPIAPIILEKVAEVMAEKEKRIITEKSITAPPMTAERHEQYLKDNIESMTKENIKSLIKQFDSRNLFGGNDKIIEFLKEELKNRK